MFLCYWPQTSLFIAKKVRRIAIITIVIVIGRYLVEKWNFKWLWPLYQESYFKLRLFCLKINVGFDHRHIYYLKKNFIKLSVGSDLISQSGFMLSGQLPPSPEERLSNWHLYLNYKTYRSVILIKTILPSKTINHFVFTTLLAIQIWIFRF